MIALTLGMACVLASALLWAEHYTPWAAWLRMPHGSKISRPAAYTLGLLALIVPLAWLFVFWAFFVPDISPIYSLVALLAVVVCGGLTVYLLYLLDHADAQERAADVAQKEVAIWKQAAKGEDE